MTYGINGDFGQFKKGGINQPNNILNGEVKKAEAGSSESIDLVRHDMTIRKSALTF